MAKFKKEFPDIVETITTDCDIFSSDGRKFHTDNAMWDTGADNTVISKRVVEGLGLTPYNQGSISGIGGVSDSNVYLVHILLPSGDCVTNVEVMENDFYDYDVIIGMDIIMFGDFLITNTNDKTVFQFRTPSEGGVL